MTEDEPVPGDGDDLSLDRPLPDPDRDGVAALHDTEAEAGDEAELEDLFDLDQHEAREINADLDSPQRNEPRLD
jgi:hypothetical protein